LIFEQAAQHGQLSERLARSRRQAQHRLRVHLGPQFIQYIRRSALLLVLQQEVFQCLHLRGLISRGSTARSGSGRRQQWERGRQHLGLQHLHWSLGGELDPDGILIGQQEGQVLLEGRLGGVRLGDVHSNL